MSNYRTNAIFLVFLMVIISLPVCANELLRSRYMGSAIISMPTAYTRSATSYISDDGHTMFFASHSMLSGFIEISTLLHMNGETKNKKPISAKFKLLDESHLIPTISLGVSDIGKALGDEIHYVAISKTIDAFGIMLNGGTYKDSITKEKIKYYGLEKMILPLITVCAERVDEIDAYGVKLSPYPGVSLEISVRDNDEEIYNINYYRSF